MRRSTGAGMRILTGAIVAALAAAPAAAADVARGNELFKACAACHNESPDALGPDLRGVYGRKAAALESYRYSNPMKRANLVWDEENLRSYIADPQTKVKGNRMPYGGLREPKDVEDVIAYLKTLK
jgi:cytochrome c